MKKFLLNVFFCAVGLIVVLEVFFSYLLPASEWPKFVILDSGIRRFDCESFTDGEFTYGRYCTGGYKWTINAAGWNSVYSYESSTVRNVPMVVMLGDSYLEGFYSDVDSHIDVFLTKIFNDSVQFYTFAMSSGILSQYIALMKYEVDQYSPDAFIVFVNSSDVAKSIREIGGRHPIYFQYSVDSLGIYSEEAPIACNRSVYKDIILRSSLVRYLRANAQVLLLGGGLADENANKEEPDTEVSHTAGTQTELESAAGFLLSELNSFGKPVLIVADCPKTWIYDNTEEEAYDDVIALHKYVDLYPNVSMFDLSSYYVTEYAEQNRYFSVPGNPHWDSYANFFVAKTIAPSVRELLHSEPTLEN